MTYTLIGFWTIFGIIDEDLLMASNRCSFVVCLKYEELQNQIMAMFALSFQNLICQNNASYLSQILISEKS